MGTPKGVKDWDNWHGAHVLIDFDKDGNELSYDVDPNSVHLFRM